MTRTRRARTGRDHPQARNQFLPSLSPAMISAGRLAVRERLVRESPRLDKRDFAAISGSDLRILFEAYDDVFFQKQLTVLLESTRHSMFFEVSTRMTTAGANISRRSSGRRAGVFRIAISAPVLFSSFREPGEAFEVNGLTCTNRLQALQVLMEHELVHLYEMLQSGASGHGPSFREIARGLFGHTDYRHALMTPAKRTSTALGLRAGELVSFNFRGRRLVGTLNGVAKRATVLVSHEDGTEYSDGQKYLKFYVPLIALSKVRNGPCSAGG